MKLWRQDIFPALRNVIICSTTCVCQAKAKKGAIWHPEHGERRLLYAAVLQKVIPFWFGQTAYTSSNTTSEILINGKAQRKLLIPKRGADCGERARDAGDLSLSAFSATFPTLTKPSLTFTRGKLWRTRCDANQTHFKLNRDRTGTRTFESWRMFLPRRRSRPIRLVTSLTTQHGTPKNVLMRKRNAGGCADATLTTGRESARACKTTA